MKLLNPDNHIKEVIFINNIGNNKKKKEENFLYLDVSEVLGKNPSVNIITNNKKKNNTDNSLKNTKKK